MASSKNLKAVKNEEVESEESKSEKVEVSKKVSLEVQDRIALNQSLPAQGHYLELLATDRISKRIQITKEEIAKYNIRVTTDGQSVIMDIAEDEREQTKIEYTFHEDELAVIKKALRKAEDEGKLRRDQIKIYELFIA